MTRGFLLGKFLPPHNGHVYMINFARAYCDQLTIYLGTRSDDPIEGALRFSWLQQMFPDCRVLWRPNDTIPQHPHEDEDFRNIWCNEVSSTQQCFPYNFVFASEDYGKWIAEGIGAQFVPVDPSRTAIPISGTEIRKDIYKNWDHMPEVVRAHFTKRICVFGPESTGKSTITQHLVTGYKTVAVPEYGRTYTEMFGPEITPKDMEHIMFGHIASTRALLPKANRVLICDTDPVLSAVWSDLLTGQRDSLFDNYNDPCDLYLLMDVDIPWVDDGLRYFKDQAQRQDFFERCKRELDRRQLNYNIVRGDGITRIINAINLVNAFLKGQGIHIL